MPYLPFKISLKCKPQPIWQFVLCLSIPWSCSPWEGSTWWETIFVLLEWCPLVLKIHHTASRGCSVHRNRPAICCETLAPSSHFLLFFCFAYYGERTGLKTGSKQRSINNVSAFIYQNIISSASIAHSLNKGRGRYS